jgi:hypothetical protein
MRLPGNSATMGAHWGSSMRRQGLDLGTLLQRSIRLGSNEDTSARSERRPTSDGSAASSRVSVSHGRQTGKPVVVGSSRVRPRPTSGHHARAPQRVISRSSFRSPRRAAHRLATVLNRRARRASLGHLQVRTPIPKCRKALMVRDRQDSRVLCSISPDQES